MTIVKEFSDGTPAHFPDGTSQSVIDAVIARENAKLQKSDFFPSTDKLAGELGSGVKSGALKGVSIGLGFPADIATGLEAAGAAARTETPEAFEAGGLAGLIGGGGPSLSSGLGEALGSQNIEESIASVTGRPDRPESGLGKLVEAGTEFGTAMLAPLPGVGALKAGTKLGSKLPDIAEAGLNVARRAPALGGLGVVSGIGSESAGQVFEGTKLEGPARIAGAIIAPTTPAAIKALSRRTGLTTSGMQVLEESVGGLSEAEKNAARRRAQNAKGIGVPLAPAEAIGGKGVNQLAGDVTATTQGARVAEQNLGGQSAAVRDAVEKLNKQVSPSGGEFTGAEIGGRVQDASEELVKRTLNARSQKVGKFFKAAENQEVPIDNMSAFVDRLDEVIARAPVGGPVAKELEGVRNQLMQGQKNTPVTRIGTLDQIRQTSRENIDIRSRELGGAKKNTMAAEVGPVLDDLTDIMEKASGTFAEGMLMHRQMSPVVDAFLKTDIAGLRNATGRRAAAKKAINMVTDIDMTNPREIRENMALFNKVDPAIPPNLTRMYLDQQMRKAFAPGKEGLPASSGVRIFNRVAGTAKQKANLQAMFSSVEKSRRLKRGTLMNTLEKVLDGIEKAGTLPGAGSATAGRTSTFGRLKETATRRLRDWNTNARFDRNVEAISDLLTNPNRLEDLIRFTTRARKDVTPREIVRALAIAPAVDEE